MYRFFIVTILLISLACTFERSKKCLIRSTPIVTGSRISYPDTVSLIGDKIAFLLRAKRLNLLLHNSTGKWLREGLTKDEYDNGIDMTGLGGKTSKKFIVPNRIKDSINLGTFKAKINRSEWDSIISNDFDINLRDIEGAFSVLMDSLMKDTQYDSLITL